MKGPRVMDPALRKQIVLTRIALERLELRRDITQLQVSVKVPRLWRAFVGSAIGPARRADGAALPWTDWARWLLRRYRLAATLLAATSPLWRRSPSAHRGRRVLVVVGAAAAAWAAWRLGRAGPKRP